METTKGQVIIQLLPDLAPGHVARIKELCAEGAYDGVVFHRVIDDFMAQTATCSMARPAARISIRPRRHGRLVQAGPQG